MISGVLTEKAKNETVALGFRRGNENGFRKSYTAGLAHRHYLTRILGQGGVQSPGQNLSKTLPVGRRAPFARQAWVTAT